jgi:hypothetical protein
MVQVVRFAHSGPAKAAPLTKRYVIGGFVRFFILILVFSSPAMADGVAFKKNSEAIEKHEKVCINQPPPAHKAMFEQSELCKFGKEGCTKNSATDPFEVLCDLEMVSECYAQSAWQTRNQYFNLSLSVEVTNISHTMTFSNGKKIDTMCAYYK